MLQPALDDPDPVIIFEHAGLYNEKGDLPDELEAVAIEGAVAAPARVRTSRSSPTGEPSASR